MPIVQYGKMAEDGWMLNLSLLTIPGILIIYVFITYIFITKDMNTSVPIASYNVCQPR